MPLIRNQVAKLSSICADTFINTHQAPYGLMELQKATKGKVFWKQMACYVSQVQGETLRSADLAWLFRNYSQAKNHLWTDEYIDFRLRLNGISLDKSLNQIDCATQTDVTGQQMQCAINYAESTLKEAQSTLNAAKRQLEEVKCIQNGGNSIPPTDHQVPTMIDDMGDYEKACLQVEYVKSVRSGLAKLTQDHGQLQHCFHVYTLPTSRVRGDLYLDLKRSYDTAKLKITALRTFAHEHCDLAEYADIRVNLAFIEAQFDERYREILQWARSQPVLAHLVPA